MPIRPENKARYPKDWKAVSKRIRRRARNRCECKGECGLQHFRVGKRQIDLPPSLQVTKRVFRCQAVNGELHPHTKAKVVLTVAHLNHEPEDCRDENLRAWCQRCHNRYDAPTRAAGIKARARAAMAVADLFPEAKP